MVLKLFNTLTRKKEVFKPIKKNEVRIYSCGPTVYDYAHIGNLRTYIFADILRKSLEFLGYKVKQAINITDVGHLTQDDDSGEDKIEKSAKEKKKSAWEIARFFEKRFLKDLMELNISKPSVMPRATEHIKEQINLIKILEKKGFTYIIENDGLYFDTSKFEKYGEFAGENNLKQRMSRIGENKLKKNPWDFALWKFSPSPESGKKRQMEWSSPWGIGFPGWHIECSAMSKKYLSQPFDIHTGGVDHITVHHQNEIAQSETAFGKPLAHFWLHGEFLHLGDKRMGKSEGNLMTLDDLKKAGFHPLSFRFLCLNTHYRKKMFFSLKTLNNAQKSLNSIITLYQKLVNIIFHKKSLKQNLKIQKESHRFLKNFEMAIKDDLNLPKAIGYLFSYLSQINEELKKEVNQKDIKSILQTLDIVDKVLSILPYKKNLKVNKEILKILKKRLKLKNQKNYKASDKIRTLIEKKNYIVEDYPNFTAVYQIWPNPNLQKK